MRAPPRPPRRRPPASAAARAGTRAPPALSRAGSGIREWRRSRATAAPPGTAAVAADRAAETRDRGARRWRPAAGARRAAAVGAVAGARRGRRDVAAVRALARTWSARRRGRVAGRGGRGCSGVRRRRDGRLGVAAGTGGLAAGRAGRGRWGRRHHAGNHRLAGRGRGARCGLGGGGRRVADRRRVLLLRAGSVEPVQVVQPHQGDEVRAVLRVGRVHAREVVGERVGDCAVRHRPLVVAAGREQFGVVGDALGDVVVDAERRVDRHPLAALVLLGGQGDAARGTAALDAEQVVVLAGETAGAPRGLVDRLRDRHGRGHAETLLSGDRSGRDLVDERLLCLGPRRRRRAGRGVLPVRRPRRGRPAGGVRRAASRAA